MKQWFSIQARAGKGAISIYDEIGVGGVTAAAFADQLKALGSVSAIALSINSPGGDVFASLTIYNCCAGIPPGSRPRSTAWRHLVPASSPWPPTRS